MQPSNLLGSSFKIGAKKELHHFLSLKFNHSVDEQLVYLSQEHYIEKMSSRFLHSNTVPVSTPTDSNFKDLKRCTSEDDASPGPYQQLLGCLLWAAQCTQPNVFFDLNRLLQFIKDPSVTHW